MRHKRPKYRFQRRDTGTVCCFEMSATEFTDRVVDGVMKQTSKLDGKAIFYDFVEVANPPAKAPLAGWPCKSDSLGVELHQITEARDESIRMGVPTDFDPHTGEAIFETPGHRKKYCEAMDVFDRNGGYGDPQKRTHQELESRFGG